MTTCGAYEKSLGQPLSYLILEIVRLATLLRIDGRSLFLKPFCSSIKHLEAGSSWSLDSIESTADGRSAEIARA